MTCFILLAQPRFEQSTLGSASSKTTTSNWGAALIFYCTVRKYIPQPYLFAINFNADLCFFVIKKHFQKNKKERVEVLSMV